MNKPMHKLFMLMAVAAASLMAACNTVEGAGEDLQAAGAAIEDEAND